MEQWEGLGNQQGRLEMTLSLDYLAGLIAGEGSFCLAVHRRKDRNEGLNAQIYPIFSMFMADRDTIEQAADSLKAHGLPVYVAERPKAGRGQIGIHISGMKRCRRYCETFIPLMTGQKRRAAELVLEFIQDRDAAFAAQGKTVPYTDKQKKIVETLRAVNGNTNGRKNPL